MPTEEKTYRRDPRPGDFVPPDRTPRPPRQEDEDGGDAPVKQTAQAAPKTNIPASEAEQEATERAKLYEEMAKETAPVEDYQAFLKEHDISEEKAAEIVDNLFTQGYHVEKYKLTKRTSAELRTREHEDTLRLQTFLEASRPLYMHVMQEITARYNLAASLQRFGDRVFKFPKPEDDKETIEKLFDERLTFVERMADPAFYKLSALLARFDRTVSAVMREGVAENF